MMENVHSVAEFDPNERYGTDVQSSDIPAAVHPLDSEENKKTLNKLQEWWTQARENQSVNRYEQALDADFYDGLQWSNEDAAALKERGQAPLVYNRIKPAVDWIIGTEKRTRFDYKVQARKDEECEAAEVKTGLLKYLSDVNRNEYYRSMAFADACKVGVGWLEEGVRNDETDEPIFARYESWRNMWYDPLAVEPDLSDARFIFRSKFVDLDVAQAMFPSRRNELKGVSITAEMFTNEFENDDLYYLRTVSGNPRLTLNRGYIDGSSIYNRRERVRLIECWYRAPAGKSIIRGERFSGQEFDKTNLEHTYAVDQGYSSVYDALVMEVRCAIFTKDLLLQLEPTPYRHNAFPFTPVWGFRRSRDRAPYGVVRNIRDPQENLNKRMSKALHILSTARVIADADAATDWDEIRDEMARPDGIVLLDGRKGARFETDVDKGLAREHVNLMEIDSKMIQDVSGVTDENLGRETNAVSGRAVNARAEQGSVITTDLFDNLRFAMQQQGEKLLSLVEQFYDYTKVIRIVGDNGEPEFLHLNKPHIDPMTGEVMLLNDIAATQADFVMDSQEYRATQRRQMFDMFGELFKSLDPQITIKLMDLMFEYSDLPGREEIVSRIRKINGESDPSKKNDPEEVARAQQQAQDQAEQAMLEKRRMMAELENLVADGDKKKAEAEKIRSEMAEINVKTLYSAIQAGSQVAVMPVAAQLGDVIASSAGYVDRNAAPLIAAPTTAALPPMSRQERTIINKQLGVDSDKDGNPMTPDQATPGEGVQKGIIKPGPQTKPTK